MQTLGKQSLGKKSDWIWRQIEFLWRDLSVLEVGFILMMPTYNTGLNTGEWQLIFIECPWWMCCRESVCVGWPEDGEYVSN